MRLLRANEKKTRERVPDAAMSSPVDTPVSGDAPAIGAIKWLRLAMIASVVLPLALLAVTACAVRRLLPSLPVLLVSGYTAEADKAAAEGYRILGKPFRAEALADAIERIRSAVRPDPQPASS